MSLKQISDIVVQRNVRLRSAFIKRLFATESKDEIVDITSADEQPVFAKLDSDEMAKKRNKSRLEPAHRNIIMGQRPYDKPIDWYHSTVKYKKRMLGRYGLNAIDEPAGFAWPTLEEVKDAKEYEKVAFPLSLQERWEKLEKERQEKAAYRKRRETEILEKIAKMDQWTADINAKIAKKEAELEKARLQKERLVEEVRRHFGFKISLNDEKFKEMLAQKEKEEKKKKKEAKKKVKMERMMNMIKNQMEQASEQKTTDSTKSKE